MLIPNTHGITLNYNKTDEINIQVNVVLDDDTEKDTLYEVTWGHDGRLVNFTSDQFERLIAFLFHIASMNKGLVA